MPNSRQYLDNDQLLDQHPIPHSHSHVRNSQQQQDPHGLGRNPQQLQHDDHGHIRFSPEGKSNIILIGVRFLLFQ